MFYLGYYGKALIATFQGKASKTILSIKLLFQVLGAWRVTFLLPVPGLWSRGKPSCLILLMISSFPSCWEVDHMSSLSEGETIGSQH